MASQMHPSPVVNHLLLGRRPRGGHLRSSRSSLGNGGGGGGGPRIGGAGLPQGQSTPLDEAVRSRLQSPWRAHVRTHRRNVARARAQLEFDDPEDADEEEEEVTTTTAATSPDLSGTPTTDAEQQVEEDKEDREEKHEEEEERGRKREEERKENEVKTCDQCGGLEGGSESVEASEQEVPKEEVVTGGSSPSSTLVGTGVEREEEEGEEDVIGPVEQHLASLELDSELEHSTPSSTSAHTSTPTPETETETETDLELSRTPNQVAQPSPASTPAAPPSLLLRSTTGMRPALDSSSSESSISCPARRMPTSVSTPGGLSRYQQPPVVPFSPFPCVKAPRKSAAARNLGLYGPTSRTPTVHFPQMSKGMSQMSSSSSSTTISTRRR